MSNTVIVKNIAPATEDKEVKDFFSFCGKISDIQIKTTGETKEATVVFDKETAAKTALLLNNSQLGQNSIEVKSATGDQSDDGSHFAKSSAAGERGEGDDEIRQEEKPRTRILAEYLAHGYVVGDVALERAIELDHKHGVTSRFLSTLQGLDQKYHASDRARATDQSYGLSARAGNLLSGIGSYFEKATNTPTGKKIVQFYEEGSRQVQDIHAEARRLADLKTEQAGGSAYKAAGLEKVFGKEKEKTAEAAPGTAPAEGAKAAETETAPKA